MTENELGEAIAAAETVVPDDTIPADGEREFLPPGAKIGRYVLLGELGRGGMGSVYKAYDPELDRPIALKIVRVVAEGTESSGDSRTRLAREAQAIAKVSHPNVVAVHDVGVAGHNVFIAMEFVSGVTLRRWTRRAPRSWREIVTLYVAAGRGLAAAHSAGLIHRDFKPENVLVGTDGRPRVLDFGLVRAVDDDSELTPDTMPPADERSVSVSSGRALTTPLTRAGEIMGTPGYMAPEQYYGKAADEKSDQFSFCVSLYEGLYGERPYPGSTVAEIKARIAAREIPDEPSGTKVPSRVRQLLLRGLQTEKAARHESMDALLDALERAAATGPRQRLVAIGVVAALALIAALAGQLGARSDPPCRGADRHMTGVWDEPVRGAVAKAFEGFSHAHASATRARVERDLDRFRDAWIAKHTEVCEATRVHGEQSETAMDLRMRCLDHQLAEMRELTRVLAAGDEAVLARAAVATGRLSDVDDCDDIHVLGAVIRPPSDPAAREQIDRIDAQLARVKALSDSGKIAEAREGAEAALSEATAIGFEPLIADAYFKRGIVDRLEGKGEAARDAMFEAVIHADLTADDVLRANATIELVFIEGYLLAKPELGLADGERATAIVRRLGNRAKLEALLLSNIGVIYHDQQRYGEATEKFLASLELRERVFGDDSFELISALNNIGSALNELGRNDEARQHLDRAVHILEDLFGPSHPHLAAVLVNLGLAVNDLGQYDEALEHYRRATTIYEQIFGPEHRMVAPALNNQADVLASLGRLDEAMALYQRSVRIRESAYGTDHPLLALTLLGYGSTLAQSGRDDDALVQLQRALAIWEKAFGAEHADVARALHRIGQVHRRQRRYRPALAVLERALAIDEKTLGADHAALAPVLGELGQLYLDMKRPERAAPVLERALGIAEAKNVPEPGVAIVRFALARALWSSPPDRARARVLAEQARAVFETRGTPTKELLRNVDRWLARR